MVVEGVVEGHLVVIEVEVAEAGQQVQLVRASSQTSLQTKTDESLIKL